MESDKRKIASISANFIHGTAERVSFESVVPADKSEKEVFWTTILVNNITSRFEYKKIESNPDDSCGNHDVIITMNHGSIIGVQVTELTYEFERARKHIKSDYINKIIQEIKHTDLESIEKVVFSFNFPHTETKKPNSEKPKMVVDAIRKLIANKIEEKIHQFEFGNVVCHLVKEGDFFIPNVNNIGIDVNFDILPHTLDMYSECIDAIVSKKSNSLSSWLLIWSLEFWKDRHWLGNELIDYMKSQFKESKFEKVFFIESMDGDGFFQANLKIDVIK
jgi:hypothetical protein